jgi:hypothetical protein
VSRSLVALALLGACAFACGADAARPDVVMPGVMEGDESSGPELAPVRSSARGRDAGPAPTSASDASAPSARAPFVPEPEYGMAESPKPGDPHAFRLAVAVRAMRATPSGAKVVKMLSVIPEVIETKARTGVDPFQDSEWLLVYGSKVEVPGPNANVVKHGRPAAVVTAMLDAGIEAWDGGSSASSPVGTARAARVEMYGVRDVLLRPQPGVLALVPGDRARDLAAVLAGPVDPGVRPGELARIALAAPSTLLGFLPTDVTRGIVTVKAAPDGGLDASAEADCADAASCKATLAALEALVQRRAASLMVRIATRNLLSNLSIRVDGVKLKATLHAAPDQVTALLNLVRAQLGLPGADPGDQVHSGP